VGLHAHGCPGPLRLLIYSRHLSEYARQPMCRHLFLSVLALTVAIAPAAEADEATLPGLAAYRTGDFEGAVKQLREAMPNLRSWERMRAWTYLSASLFALGRTDEAELNLRQLFREFPDAKPDPSVFEPGLVALSERVHAEETTKTEAITKKVQKPFATPPPKDVPVVTKSRSPLPYIATGGAVVALGAGAWFATSSSNQRNQLDRSFDPSGRSTLTYPEAQALAGGANRDVALVAVSAATSATLTGLAIWLWTRSEE
jgi:tetratricopeptide (TPR) repeat protein